MNAPSEIKAFQMDENVLITVLETSLYPGVSSTMIAMVIQYCKAANLDPMLKPVHVVGMWDRKAGKMREVIMPGIGLYRIQAARSGTYCGISEPEFGPIITEKIGGVETVYPEWCRITVRKLFGGMVGEFTAIEYWRENYAEKGGKERSVAPNDMWRKRSRGQIAKCAEAQALRKAFPEVGAMPTAEEMEGRELEIDGDTLIDGETGEIIRSDRMPKAKAAPEAPPAAPETPPPAAPAAPETPPPATGTQATGAAAKEISEGQVKFLQKKISSNNLDEAALCAQFQVPAINTSLTQAQFGAIKNFLLG
jgi:phage recombination protein Bet